VSLPPRVRSVAVLALIVLAGCSDRGPSDPDERTRIPIAGPSLMSAAGILVPEHEMQAHMQSVARAVAVALQDDGMRQLVLDEIQRSPYQEQKLHFRSLLTGRGAVLLDRMATATARSPQSILAVLDSIIDLEFYMPVPAHRALWQGGPDVLVATVLHDDGTIPTGIQS